MDSDVIYCIHSLIGVYRRLFELGAHSRPGAYYWYGRLPPGALSGQALFWDQALFRAITVTTIRGWHFEQLKTFATNSRSLKNWKNWLRINTNQLRTSRTDYDSTTNPKMYQLVAIRCIRGLCGIEAFMPPFHTDHESHESPRVDKC